jgi:hypothetical protein
MMRNKAIIFLITLMSVFYCFSQTDQKKTALTVIINAIEQKFDVKFSYSVNDVNNIFINAPQTTFSLEETIDFLNQNTLLNFKLLNDRYITVSVIDKTISICGQVLSLPSNSPLFGASILVKDTTLGTITNENGVFSFEDISINAILKVSYLGYQSEEFLAKGFFSEQGNCKQIELTEETMQLNQVFITKFLTTGLQKRLDGSTVLNTEKFGILPGLIEPDILQSIQALPGVESANESIANINVRGGTNDQNLMLWDNIKMYHSGHFFGLISAYNPNLTNKVVVIKNGTSSEFSDGVSSTINMFTKNEIDNKFSGGAGLNLINVDAFLEIPIAKNLELHISGRRSFTDVFTSPTYDNYFKRSFQDSEITTNSDNIEESNTSSDFLFYDYTAKILFNLNDNHKFRANVIGINNQLFYTESFTNSANEVEAKTSNLSQENIGIGSSWIAKWSDAFSTEFTGYYSNYNVDATDYRIKLDQRLTQANEVLETGLKLKTYYKVNKNLTLLNGYQFNETGILNETTVNAPSYERTKKDVVLNHAFFSEAEYNKNKTYFRIGVRANYFQKFNKLLIEPRLNIRQKLNNQFALKLEGEFKNQSATQIVDFQDDFLGVENRRWILANEQNIPISTSKQGSFGVEFNYNNLAVELTGFYKMVDGITASNQGFYNNFQYLNAVGDYTVKGVEFLVNKTTTNFSTWLSYTYSTNNYFFETFTPSEFPNNVDIRHSVSLAFNYNILENLKISLGGLWRSGQPYTKPVDGNETIESGNNTFVNYDAPNNQNLDSFKRLDASLSYNINLDSNAVATVRAGVINLLNNQNVINRYYEVDPNNSDKAIQIDNLSLEMTPNVSLRIKF